MFGMVARHFSRSGGERQDGSEPLPADEVRPLIEDIAEGIYRAELRRGGWAAEIGTFGPDLFKGEASACLRAIELGDGQDGPPSP